MRHEGYRIEDEPRPSALSHLTVRPFWPLLGWMFGGTWIAWPWFMVNGVAMGSPTLGREIGLIFVGALGIVGIFAGGVGVLDAFGLDDVTGIRFIALAVTLWKLAVSYFLHGWQARTFSLYEHYGGRVRNGVIVVIAAAVLQQRLAATLPPVLAFLLR